MCGLRVQPNEQDFQILQGNIRGQRFSRAWAGARPFRFIFPQLAEDADATVDM